MAAPERAGAFSPSAAATVPGGPVLIGLAAAVMAGGRAALAYMADIAAVVLFAAALLALLRTFLGPLPAGAAFLVTGALGLCLRRLMAAYTPSLLMEMGAEGLFFVVFLFCGPAAAALAEGKPGFSIRRVWLFALGGLILGLAREFLASGSLFGVELADGVSESFGFSTAGRPGLSGLFLAALFLALWGLRERRLFPYTTRDGLRIGVYAALTVLLSAWAAGGLRQVLPASPAFLGDLLALLVTVLLVLVGGAVLPRERFFRDGVLTACAALAAVWASRADAAALLWIPAAAAGILALAFFLFAPLYGRADNIHLPAPFRTPPAVMLLITGALVALSVL